MALNEKKQRSMAYLALKLNHRAVATQPESGLQRDRQIFVFSYAFVARSSESLTAARNPLMDAVDTVHIPQKLKNRVPFIEYEEASEKTFAQQEVIAIMSKRNQHVLFSFLATGLFGAVFVACSGSSPESSPATENAEVTGYQGIGSKWTAEFTDDTFEITYDSQPDGTIDMRVEGTYEEYANKFRKLTVTAATGTGAPSVGDEAVGLEIPGFAFFLKPMTTDAEPIVLVKAGQCPTEDFVGNWIIAKYQEPEETPQADQDAMGAAEFDITGNSATISQRRFDDGSSLGSGSPITLTSCDDGVQEFDDGGDGGVMYLTANGGALVNPGSGIIFSAPQLAADVLKTDVEGTYSGLVFSSSNSGDKIFPAKITLDNDAEGTGVKITDLAADSVESSGVTFDLEPVATTKGLLHGTVDAGNGANPVNCLYSSIDGADLLACNGADDAAQDTPNTPGDATDDVFPSFFFLGVKR